MSLLVNAVAGARAGDVPKCDAPRLSSAGRRCGSWLSCRRGRDYQNHPEHIDINTIMLCYSITQFYMTVSNSSITVLGCIDIRFSHSTSLYSESHPFPWANLAPNIDSSGSEYLQSLGRHSPVTLHLTSVTSGDLHLRSALSQVLHLLLICFPWFIMAHRGSSTAMHLVEESDRRWPPPPQSDAIISYTESYRDSNITIVTWVNWKGKETRKWTQ